MQNSPLREKFNFAFQEIFPNISKIFILAGKLGTRLLFYEALGLSNIFQFPKILSLKSFGNS